MADYEKSQEVTCDRLHLETMEKILPDADKVTLDGNLGQRLLPLMPLGTSPLLPASLLPATEPMKGNLPMPAKMLRLASLDVHFAAL